MFPLHWNSSKSGGKKITCYDNRESCIFNIACAPSWHLVSCHMQATPPWHQVQIVWKKAKLNLAKCVNLLLEDIPTAINKINKIRHCQELPHVASWREGVLFPHQRSLKTREMLLLLSRNSSLLTRVIPQKHRYTLRLLAIKDTFFQSPSKGTKPRRKIFWNR